MSKKSSKSTKVSTPPITRLRTDRGEDLQLGEPIHHGGGEGVIYEVASQPPTSPGNQVVKLYHDQRRTPDREVKLKVMLAQPPPPEVRHNSLYNHTSVAWPENIVYYNGHFVGYTMPRVLHSRPLMQFYNPQLREQNGLMVNWGVLYDTAINLATVTQGLHRNNYIIGDLSDGNLLVNSKGLIALVDTDSFQVRDQKRGRIFYSRVVTDGYTPPELAGKKLENTERYWFHDAFGLAVVIFKLLMEGNDPFTGYSPTRPAPEGRSIYKENSARGIFPYAAGSGYEPPRGAPPFSMLPPDVQQLFQQAFVNTHQAPAARPTPKKWIEVLTNSQGLLRLCQFNAGHVYSRHQTDCPWCDREAKLVAASRITNTGVKSSAKVNTAAPSRPSAGQPQSSRQPGPPSQSQQGDNFLFAAFLVGLLVFLLVYFALMVLRDMGVLS